MIKTNYAFAKRQRDLAKKQKKEEKRQRKTGAQSPPVQEILPEAVVEETIVDETTEA
jgi:hypothetical protein